MARQNSRAARSPHGAGAARWAGRRSRGVYTIRARRRDLARLRAEAVSAAGGSPAEHNIVVTCDQCAGSGQITGGDCPACRGDGRVTRLDSGRS